MWTVTRRKRSGERRYIPISPCARLPGGFAKVVTRWNGTIHLKSTTTWYICRRCSTFLLTIPISSGTHGRLYVAVQATWVGQKTMNSIYPLIPKDTAYGFLTRGCPNKCSWCVVPTKEGAIRPYMDVDEIAIEGRHKLVLMDNNFLAAGDYAHEQLDKIISRGYRVDFNQALDARLVTDDFARKLAQVKWLDKNRIRFGCDTQKQIEDCERAMEMIISHGFKGEFFLYTMLNDNFQECYNRIHYWWDKLQEQRERHSGNWVYAYAQPYRDPSNPHRPIPQWQKDMAGWVNKKAHFLAHSFEEFQPRKGFRCIEYFRQFK